MDFEERKKEIEENRKGLICPLMGGKPCQFEKCMWFHSDGRISDFGGDCLVSEAVSVYLVQCNGY